MNATRQDAWTEDEDNLLADTVLRHIREGKTQLEAFNEVGRQLSRTSAACGFRWNASIRKEYADAIDKAREERKQNSQKIALEEDCQNDIPGGNDPIAEAISLLKRMRHFPVGDEQFMHHEQDFIQKQLIEENTALKEQLRRYDQAWEEMGKLWNWVRKPYK
ncbi:sporulation specific transcriptional regulator GerR [Barrientosiimonas marina]|uniref:RsfA family transcriptional regulator n=1 Tax=Lentibacillus kimchii TaxID=1542911 RepID=A0ABW2UP61_9BACI